MNNDETRRVLLQPSARRGIHDHPNCPFLTRQSMGRHGLIHREPTHPRVSRTPEDLTLRSQDVVDNVQSTLRRSTSPIATKHINGKRYSWDGANSASYSDHPENNKVHAQSLPTKLSTVSSEEFGQWPPPNFDSELLTNESFPRLDSRDDESGCISEDDDDQNTESLQQTAALICTNSFLSLLIPSVIVILGAIYYGPITNDIIEEIPQLFSGSNKYNKFNLNSIGDKYKITDDSLLKIQTGISTIYEREDAGSFVFAYRSDTDNFDRTEFDNFIDTIAIMASRYLREGDKSVRHLVLDGSNLAVNTHGELLTEYRENFTNNGVMVVKKLDEIPSSLAMAFHYYCDEKDPLAKRSAVIFTLDMTKCSDNPVEQKPTIAGIEKCLKKKWSGVPKDNIGPLLNRVANTVVDVTTQAINM